jgi:hypothetical protein
MRADIGVKVKEINNNMHQIIIPPNQQATPEQKQQNTELQQLQMAMDVRRDLVGGDVLSKLP